jgi:hypothetical protein
MQFRWENFNAFNSVNMNDTTAGGAITDVIVPMRQMQFGLRLSW